MPQFFSFAKGVELEDVTINQWLNDCKNRILRGFPHGLCASGDTLVTAMNYEDTYIVFNVSTKNGYSKITFYSLEELRGHTFNFSRKEHNKGMS